MKLSHIVTLITVALLSGCSKPADQAEEYYNLGKYDLSFKLASQAYSKDSTNAKAAVILWKSQIAARNCGSAEIVERAYESIRGSLTERDATILPPLEEALADRKGCIRLFAIYAMGDLPFDEAAEKLLSVLHGNLPPEVEPEGITNDLLIGETALILGKRVYKPAYEDLIKMTGSDNGVWRAKAAEALGYMGNTDAVPILKELLKDDYTADGQRIVAESARLAIKLLTGEDHPIEH